MTTLVQAPPLLEVIERVNMIAALRAEACCATALVNKGRQAFTGLQLDERPNVYHKKPVRTVPKGKRKQLMKITTW